MRLLHAASLASFALVASLAGCAGSIPEVEILEAVPDALSAADDARDDLTITIRYSDPDGDLGQGTLRVIDCRAEGLVTLLPIPRIANDEAVRAGVPIEGEMSFVVADIGVVEPSATVPSACAELGVPPPSGGAQVFCVVLTDTAGNDSDGACTEPISVQ